ncbi:monocarboxylate transporter 7-like [Moschus berezovskii]|uniref:monocarboxylate transporter 7-like n=1 Tax=Moschus berezovskii TaxID=68408 RepID=UPI00244465C0|nr:monocarboxylate transporter 7-like [Moschus berezovskii]
MPAAGAGAALRDPAADRNGKDITFRDPRPRLRAGARPARPRPRGPARARQAGPLLGGAPRSQHMVGGAPPRPAETGCSRCVHTRPQTLIGWEAGGSEGPQHRAEAGRLPLEALEGGLRASFPGLHPDPRFFWSVW